MQSFVSVEVFFYFLDKLFSNKNCLCWNNSVTIMKICLLIEPYGGKKQSIEDFFLPKYLLVFLLSLSFYDLKCIIFQDIIHGNSFLYEKVRN